jgi:hypothetical protein
MPQWQTQLAVLEKEIFQLQTGVNRPVREFSGLPSPGSPSTASPTGDDRALEAVDRADRVGIRGQTRYADETGQVHELETAPYYFRDRASGRIYSSELPDPPADGHDYEVLRPLD